MAIRFFLLIAVLIITSCSKRLDELMMNKSPYTGSELRIDGYYMSSPNSSMDVGVGVFYRDGVCIHFFFRPETLDTMNYIESEFLLNESFINDAKSKPSWLGVFEINDESLNFETWEAGRNITTFNHFADILNDTTFILRERVDNLLSSSSTENLTYRFKEFSPKPDSTNMFIN